MPSALFIQVEKEQIDVRLNHRKTTLTELSLLLTHLKIIEKEVIGSIEKTINNAKNSP